MEESEKAMVEQCVRTRQPLPARLLNAPQLWEGQRFYYLVFLDLTSCRSLGQGQGPIPWLAIADYCDRHGIAGDLMDDVFYLIPRMDKAYIHWNTEQTKRNLAASAPPPGPKARTKR